VAGIRESSIETSTLFSSTQQYEKQSGELTANIKTSSNELSSLDTSIRKFYGEVDEYRRKIAQTNEEASELIANSEATLKQVGDETTDKLDSAIESFKIESAAKSAEIASRLEDNVAEFEQSFSKLQTNTTSKISIYENEFGEKVDATLAAFDKSSSEFLSESKQKLDELEQQLAERSDSTIVANAERTQTLIAELETLKGQIKAQIQQATGFALFGAFQARQNEVAKSKRLWAIAIGVLVLISAGVTVWIAHEAQAYSAYSFAFWVKLSLTIPLGFAITFCTVQYSRERRLEEEYAFKSSISVSLNPYRDLVHSILERDGPIDSNKYTDFVIGSVNNVFTSPTERVFESERKPALTKKTFKDVAEVIGTAVKAAKP
jgi:hypothetical protein